METLFLTAEFVVAAAGLRRGHSFALCNIDGVHRFALTVDHFVRATTGSVIAAVQSHNNPPCVKCGQVPPATKAVCAVKGKLTAKTKNLNKKFCAILK